MILGFISCTHPLQNTHTMRRRMFKPSFKKPLPSPILPGQESVWSYPRPPAVERTSKTLQVIFANTLIAETTHGWRVLETSHPPVYYIPTTDVEMSYLQPIVPESGCEWKGRAQYFDLIVADHRSQQAAWTYPEPTDRFKMLQGHIAFYAQRTEQCLVDGEVVVPQPGEFYGGWITGEIVGPFKGVSGSYGW